MTLATQMLESVRANGPRPSLPAREHYEQAHARARQALGDAAYQAAAVAGSALTTEEALAEAVLELDLDGDAGATPAPFGPGAYAVPSFCQTRDRSRMPPQSAASATASSAVNRSTTESTYSAYRHPGESVTAVAQRLLAQHGELRGLFRLDVAELERIRGLGAAKAVRLQATLELDGGWLSSPGGAASGRRAGGRGQPAQHRDGGAGAGAAAGGAAGYQAPHPRHAHRLSRQRQPDAVVNGGPQLETKAKGPMTTTLSRLRWR